MPNQNTQFWQEEGYASQTKLLPTFGIQVIPLGYFKMIVEIGTSFSIWQINQEMGDLGLQLKPVHKTVLCFSHNHCHNCFKKHSFNLFILFIRYHITFLICNFTLALFVCFLQKFKVLPFCWFNLITFYILHCLERFIYIYMYKSQKQSVYQQTYSFSHAQEKTYENSFFPQAPALILGLVSSTLFFPPALIVPKATATSCTYSSEFKCCNITEDCLHTET